MLIFKLIILYGPRTMLYIPKWILGRKKVPTLSKKTLLSIFVTTKPNNQTVWQPVCFLLKACSWVYPEGVWKLHQIASLKSAKTQDFNMLNLGSRKPSFRYKPKRSNKCHQNSNSPESNLRALPGSFGFITKVTNEHKFLLPGNTATKAKVWLWALARGIHH